MIYYIEQATHNKISNLYLDEEGLLLYLLALSAGLWAYFHARFESGQY